MNVNSLSLRRTILPPSQAASLVLCTSAGKRCADSTYVSFQTPLKKHHTLISVSPLNLYHVLLKMLKLRGGHVYRLY